MSHNANELPLLSAGIAIILAENMTSNELNFYGNLLAAIGAEMMTIAAARDLFQKDEQSDS